MEGRGGGWMDFRFSTAVCFFFQSASYHIVQFFFKLFNDERATSAVVYLWSTAVHKSCAKLARRYACTPLRFSILPGRWLESVRRKATIPGKVRFSLALPGIAVAFFPRLVHGHGRFTAIFRDDPARIPGMNKSEPR